MSGRVSDRILKIKRRGRDSDGRILWRDDFLAHIAGDGPKTWNEEQSRALVGDLERAGWSLGESWL